MIARKAAAIASVEPQVTTISVSGSSSGQPNLRYLAAMAARSLGEPHVTGYWLYPSRMARWAAAFSSSGASKSGNPWARLIALSSSASRVISQITNSVNRPTLAADEAALSRAAWGSVMPLCLRGAPGATRLGRAAVPAQSEDVRLMVRRHESAPLGDPGRPLLDLAGGYLHDLPAPLADEVMMVTRLAQPVRHLALAGRERSKQARVRQRPQGSVDGGEARTAQGTPEL